jgi:hypothetical protein
MVELARLTLQPAPTHARRSCADPVLSHSPRQRREHAERSAGQCMDHPSSPIAGDAEPPYYQGEVYCGLPGVRTESDFLPSLKPYALHTSHTNGG